MNKETHACSAEPRAESSLVGQAAATALFSNGDMVSVPSSLVAGAVASLKVVSKQPATTRRALIELGRAAVMTLAQGATLPPPPDQRIQQMIAWAESRLDGAVGLQDAASSVDLSPGRARHLFVSQTGLAFRTYLLWRRLNKALELYGTGNSLTDAAHASGFSDSAHLSRTFRRMFGVAAAQLQLT